MEKIALISCLLAVVVLPLRTAGDTNPRRGLKRAIVSLAAFYFLYLIGILYVLPRL